jgi:hypothetical protein
VYFLYAADDSSEMLDHVLRILFTEVLGYRIQHLFNPRFLDQLPRCIENKFDFHAQIWRTDWTSEQWQEAFYGDTSTATCLLIGGDGLLGQNAWYASTKHVRAFALATPEDDQPIALDFWRAYATVNGVAQLPRYDPQAAANGTYGQGLWFVPPLCQPLNATCGIAFGINEFFEPGVPQQQIVNLRWKVALFFPRDAITLEPDMNRFARLVTDAVARGQQVLALASNTATVVSTPLLTQVALPPSSKACHADTAVHMDGLGGMNCEFKAQALYKVSGVNSDTDKNDAFAFFNVFQFDHEAMIDLLSHVYAGTSVPDAACAWTRNNTDVWTSWIRPATPHKHLVALHSSTAAAVYSVMSVFLALTVGAHLFLLVFQFHPVIRRSSHLFNQLLVFGGGLWFASLLIGVQHESAGTCVAVQFVMSVAFTLFFMSFVLKNLRILLIFNAKQLQAVRLPDRLLLSYLAAYGGLDLLVVLLWASVDAPLPMMEAHTSDPFGFVRTCSSEHTPTFRTVLYLLRGVALLFGAFLAVRVRGVPDAFSESKILAACCYNVLIVSAVVVGMSLIGSNDPEVVVGTWTVGVSVAVFLSLVIFLAPKIQLIMSRTNGLKGKGGTGRAAGAGTNGAAAAGGLHKSPQEAAHGRLMLSPDQAADKQAANLTHGSQDDGRVHVSNPPRSHQLVHRSNGASHSSQNNPGVALTRPRRLLVAGTSQAGSQSATETVAGDGGGGRAAGGAGGGTGGGAGGGIGGAAGAGFASTVVSRSSHTAPLSPHQVQLPHQNQLQRDVRELQAQALLQQQQQQPPPRFLYDQHQPQPLPQLPPFRPPFPPLPALTGARVIVHTDSDPDPPGMPNRLNVDANDDDAEEVAASRAAAAGDAADGQGPPTPVAARAAAGNAYRMPLPPMTPPGGDAHV